MTVEWSRTTMRHSWLKRLAFALPVALLVTVLDVALAAPAFAQDPDAETPAPTADPAGTAIGSPENLPAVAVGGGALSADEVAQAKERDTVLYNALALIDQNRLATNFVWVLVCGYLVMFMQAGFALVETGFSRAKSAMQVMMTNFMVYGIGMLAFWAVGFAFAFGGVGGIRDGWTGGPGGLGGLPLLDQEWTINGWGILGHKGFFLGPNTFDVAVAVMFLFQMVFMDTAATILTGAVAERWKWTSFVLWSVFVGAFVYPVFANWVWGGGWLGQLGASGMERGYLDFAGSSVVHAVGGFSALAAAIVLGPRLGKYNPDGTPNPMPGHN